MKKTKINLKDQNYQNKGCATYLNLKSIPYKCSIPTQWLFLGFNLIH